MDLLFGFVERVCDERANRKKRRGIGLKQSGSGVKRRQSAVWITRSRVQTLSSSGLVVDLVQASTVSVSFYLCTRPSLRLSNLVIQEVALVDPPARGYSLTSSPRLVLISIHSVARRPF